MHSIRRAGVADAALIAGQRCEMFQANKLSCVVPWEKLQEDSEAWLADHLAKGTYVGFLVENEGKSVGGAGVWFMEWPPHFLHIEPVRGYLLNFYVADEMRGQGIAKELVGLAVEECRTRGVKIAVLHASPMGRPVYEGLGWKANNEMVLHVDSL